MAESHNRNQNLEDSGSTQAAMACTEKNVLDIVSYIPGKKIRLLAVQLDIKEPHLTDIQSCGQEDERRSKLVQIWFDQCQPCWEDLIDALLQDSMNEGHVVRKIRHFFLRKNSSLDRPKSPLTPLGPRPDEDVISPAIPAYECNEKNVANAISGLSYWKASDLALQLDLERPQRIDIEGCDKDMRTSKLAELWFRHARDEEPAWSALLTALRKPSIKEGELAAEIKAKYIQGSNPVFLQNPPEHNDTPVDYSEDTSMDTQEPPLVDSPMSIPVESPTNSQISPPVHSSMDISSVEASMDDTPMDEASINTTFSRDIVQKKSKEKIRRLWGELLVNMREKLTRKFQGKRVGNLVIYLISCNDSCGYHISDGSKMTVRSLFHVLTTNKVWSYENFSILEDIVRSSEYGDSEMEKMFNVYQSQYIGHSFSSKIALELPYRPQDEDFSSDDETNGSTEALSSSLAKRVLRKLRVRYRVNRISRKYVEELWTYLRRQYSIPALAASLDSIIEGSIRITWLIAPSWGCRILEHLFQSEQFFKEQGITEMEIDSVCIFDGSFAELNMVNRLWLRLAIMSGKKEEVERFAHCTSVGSQLLVEARDLQQPFDGNLVSQSPSLLLVAVEFNFLELIDYCLQALTDKYNLQDLLDEALHLAASKGYSDMLKILHTHGANTSFISEDGFTALKTAAAAGYTPIVDHLADLSDEDDPIPFEQETSFSLAVKGEHIEVVERLLHSKQRGQIDIHNIDGRTPLMIAVLKRLPEFVHVITEAGAMLDLKNSDGKTALMMAAESGQVDTVQILLKKKADIHVQDSAGKTAVHLAAENGHLDVIEIFVRPEYKAVLSIRDNDDRSAQDVAKTDQIAGVLRKALPKIQQVIGVIKGAIKTVTKPYLNRKIIPACKSGNLEQVRVCLESGVPPDYVDALDAFNWTGLTWAAQNGHADVVKLLLEKGADPNLPTRGTWTPTILASRNGHYKVVRHLVDHKADVLIQNWQGWTALMWASQARGRKNTTKEAMENRVKTAEILLEKDPSKLVNICANDKWSPLMQASLDKNVGMVKLLTEKGADTGLFNNKNWTALMIATKHKRIDVVKALVKAGAKVDLQNPKDEMSPLHVACEKKHNECLRAMVEPLLERAIAEPLSAGATAEPLSEEATTEPLSTAAAEPSLKEDKAKPRQPKPVINLDIKDKWGMTPLILATKHGNKEATELLVKAGANVNIKSEKYAGWSALHFAVKEGYLEIAKLLVVNKANMQSKDKNQQTPLKVAYSQRRDIYESLKSFLAGKPQVLKAIKSTPEAPAVSPTEEMKEPGVSTLKPQSVGEDTQAPISPEVPLSPQSESESIPTDMTLEELLQEVETESRPANKIEIRGLEKEYRKFRAKAMDSGSNAAGAA